MNPAFIVDGFTELNILHKLCPNQPIKRSINGKDVSLKRQEITEVLAKKGIVMDIRIGVADRMIGNWILADADALNNHPEIPTETDGISGKSWMKKIKTNYSETADGPDLFLKADALKIYEQSPSFKHFVDQLKDLDCFYLNFNK